MNKQWNELKSTITDMRDNYGTGTQREVCGFLVKLMNRLEKQMSDSEKANKWINKTQSCETDKIIVIKKGTLKARTGKYVIYDVEWLKTHFNTTEAKIYGQSQTEGARGDIPLQQSVPEMPQPKERTEERTETHACDCISREAVLDSLRSWFAEGFNEDRWWSSTCVLDIINKAPSATPQPKTEPQQKTGHWEWVQYESKPNFGNWHCSECRCILRGAINGNPIRLPKYCPECGAKMQEEKK